MSESDPLLGESSSNAAQGHNSEGSQRDGDNKERQYTFYPSEALTFAFMGAVVMMVAVCFDLGDEQPCELKKALDSIYLKYTINPCKYNTIKEIADRMSRWGISLFCWSALLVFLSSVLHHLKVYIKWGGYCRFAEVVYISYFLVSMVFGIALIVNNSRLKYAGSTEGNVDYTQLQSLMLSNLEDHYASEKVSTEDKYSRAWNEFFIKYDCCAVREVQGSTNDFVNTPWCTKSGSCKAKSSKIPKTCCKDVTLDDYQNAPTTCFVSVNPGTYKQSCISRMRELSVSHLDEGTVHTLATYAVAIGIYEFFILGWALKQSIKEMYKLWKAYCNPPKNQ